MKATKAPGAARKKVLIVDDHPILREGLGRIINQQSDMILCGEAGDAPSGLSTVARLRPDVVIVDISLEEGSGLELIKDIHSLHPELPVLALSMHHEDLYAERALHAGANGYVMKREPATVLISALRKVLQRKMAVSDSILNRLVGQRLRSDAPASHSAAELLSDRELEIYRYLGEGHGTREIAAKLRIAVSTVESYRANIKEKLRLKNATELVSSATRFVSESKGGSSAG